MDGTYDNDYSKIALAVTSAQLAKSTTVKELGIGEDLAMNFFGWDNESLSIVCQMRQDIMKHSPEERLDRSYELCSALRKYWGITSITMVAEGYCSMDQVATSGVELSKAFLDPKKPVKECLTVTHVSTEETDGADPITTVVAIPYTYGIGREIAWHDMLVYLDGIEKNFRNSKFPEAMKKALKHRVAEDLPEEAFDELRSLINANGFHIQEFY